MWSNRLTSLVVLVFCSDMLLADRLDLDVGLVMNELFL